MPTAPLRVRPSAAAMSAAFDAVRAEAGVPAAFPPEVLAEAEDVVRRGPDPEVGAAADLLDVPFVTLDPPGSRDLDQAVSIERAGAGFVVHYAIADVAAFVAPGGAVDTEARRRGLTVYLPDRRSPLHPPVLSEGGASLLPDEERQAVVWRFALDADGAVRDVDLRRARIRSRRQLSYPEVQAALDAGTADEQMVLVAEVGRLREAQEAARGGVDLPLPEQIAVDRGDGSFDLELRAPLPVEGWNAQISLMTGMEAATLMLAAGAGILRTLPPPDPQTVDDLRRRAKALRIAWPKDGTYAAFIRSLDPADPDHAALLNQAARLFRGAGYVGFAGAPPEASTHAAVAAPYAHVTAPLRRLVDRFGTEIALSRVTGAPVPAWVTDALDALPELMADARRREGSASRMAVDVVEAAVLGSCIGSELDGVVLGLDRGRAQVQVRRPAVVSPVEIDVDAGLHLGDVVRVRVRGADMVTRKVDLELVSAERQG